MRLAPLLLAVTLAACQSDGPATETPEAPIEVQPPTTPLEEPAADSERYTNERFGYALRLAPSLEPVGAAPQNDDGRTFATPDGTVRLTVFGYNDALDAGLDGVFERAREGIEQVAYRGTPPGGVAVSGTAGDSTLYGYGLYRDGVGVVARVRYLSGDADGAALADRIAQTLRWTDAAP